MRTKRVRQRPCGTRTSSRSTTWAKSRAAGLFLVFEYVPGPTLRERIAAGRRRRSRSRASRWSSARRSRLRTKRASSHRDVKPENIICSPTGAVLADFGLARLRLDVLPPRATLGTVAYSAPETLAEGGVVFACVGSSSRSRRRSTKRSLANARSPAGRSRRRSRQHRKGRTSRCPKRARRASRLSERATHAHALRRCHAPRAAEGANARYPSCRAFGEALGLRDRRAYFERFSDDFDAFCKHRPARHAALAEHRLAAALAVIIVLLLIGRGEQNKARTTPRSSPLRASSRRRCSRDIADRAFTCRRRLQRQARRRRDARDVGACSSGRPCALRKPRALRRRKLFVERGCRRLLRHRHSTTYHDRLANVPAAADADGGTVTDAAAHCRNEAP